MYTKISENIDFTSVMWYYRPMADPVDLKSRCRDWFMSNPTASYRDAAHEFDLDYETVKSWGKTDGWTTKRILSGVMDNYDQDVLNQAEGIRAVLFARIVASDGVSARDLSELVKTWQLISRMSDYSSDKDVLDRDELDRILSEED